MPEQVLKNIYRLEIPLKGSPLKDLNVYLIRDENRSLLIDTGYRNENCREALLEQLAQLGLHPGDMDVLLTHMHLDHSGLCKEVAGEKGKIYISCGDRFVIESEASWKEFWKRNDSRMMQEGFPREQLEVLPLRDPEQAGAPPKGISHVCLDDGDVIQVGGYRLQSILTPGHTPGHMCFWIEEEGVMFLGDHVLFDISPNISIWDSMPDALGAYLNSLKKIAAYPVKLPLPAHRGRGDVQERVDTLLEHHEKRLKETLSAVRRNPGQSAFDLAAKLTWRIRANSWEDFPLAQKWFAVGETVAHLDHLVVRGQVRRELENGAVKYFAK